MTYQQFVIVVKETVAQSLGDDINLQIHTTLKNNSRERVGLTITSKQSNISPTIYLEEYYNQFQNGLSLEEIAESIELDPDDIRELYNQIVAEVSNYSI